MQRRSDQLVAKALGSALMGADPHDVAVRLASIACGDEWPVRDALARVRRANRERSSRVARMAEATLLRVLQLVTTSDHTRAVRLDLTEAS
jgi:hypothetical protein